MASLIELLEALPDIQQSESPIGLLESLPDIDSSSPVGLLESIPDVAEASEEAGMDGIKMVAGKEGPLAFVAGTYIPTDVLFPEGKGFMAGEVTPERYEQALAKVNAMTSEEAAKIGARVDQAQFSQPKAVIPEAEQAELSRVENAQNEFARSAFSAALQPAQALALADRALFERSELGRVGEMAAQRGQMFEGWQQSAREAYPTDPRYQGEFLASTLPQAAGSVLPFALAGQGGAVLSSSVGALMTAQSEYDSAKAAGASEEAARKAALVGLPIGLLEGLGPIGKSFDRPGGFKSWLGGAIKEGMQEVSQSGLQTLNASYISRYDPNRRMSGKELLETGAAGALIGGGMTAVPAYLNRGVTPDDGTGIIPEEEGPDYDSILREIEDRDEPDLSGFGSSNPAAQASAPPAITPEQQISATILGEDPTELRQQEAIVDGTTPPAVEEEVVEEEVVEEPIQEAPILDTPEAVEAPLSPEEGQDTTQATPEATAAPEGLSVLDPDSYERLADEPVAEGFVAYQDPVTNDIFQVPQDATPELIQTARERARSESLEAEFEMLRKEQQRLDEVARTQKQLLSGPPIYKKNLVPAEPVKTVWRDVDKLTFTLDREKGRLAEAKKNLARLQSSANQRAKQEAAEEVKVRTRGVEILQSRVDELTPKVEEAKKAVKGMKRSKPMSEGGAIGSAGGRRITKRVRAFNNSIAGKEQYVELIRNPSPKEMKEMGESVGSVGAIITEDGVFAWDRGKAYHSNVSPRFTDLKGGLPVLIYGTGRNMAVHVTDYSKSSPFWHSPKAHDLISNHPFFKGKDVEISYYDEDVSGSWRGMRKKPNQGEAGFVTLPQPLVDLGIALHRGGVEFREWSRSMLKSVGDQVRPFLKQIWDAVVKLMDALAPANRRAPSTSGMRRSASTEGGAIGSAGGRRQGPPPQTPPAATEEASQGRPESTSNESSAQTRADLGMDPRIAPVRRTDPEVWDEAMAKLAAKPSTAINLVKSLQQNNRVTEDWEQMLLLYRKIELLKEEDAVLDEIATSTKESQVEFAQEELKRVQTDLAELTIVMENTGSSTARSLRIRQQFREDDFSLSRMRKIKRTSANNGKPLSEAQEEELVKAHKDLQDANNATKLAEAKAKDAEAQLTFQNLIKEFKAEKAQGIKAGLKAGKNLADIFIERGDIAAERLRERLKKVGAFPDVGIFKDVVEIALGQIAKGVKTVAQFTEELVAKYGEDIRPYADPAWQAAQAEKASDDKKYGPPTDPTPADILKDAPTELDPRMVFDLAKAYVRQGVEGMENVMDRVHADLVKFLPGITVRDVRDAFSGYGKVTFPSKEEDLVKLRQYKELARLTSQYEDVLKRQAPLRTGPQRDKMGVEARLLQKKINDMMKALGIQTTSQEQQLKSAADAVKTRLKNQIEELEQAIKRNQALPTNQRTVNYDGETKALQARRDALRTRYDEIFKPQGKTQAEKIQAILKNLDKSIAAEDQLLKAGIFKRPPNAPQPTSTDIENKRMELDAMRQLRRELYARTQPRKSPEDIALEQAVKAAKASIERMDQMLKTGNLTPAQRAQRFNPTAELEALWSERDALRDAVAELRKAAKPRTDPEETRRKQAVKALEKSIRDLDERMLRGDFGAAPRKATRPEVKEISDLRDLRDFMRQAFNDLKKAQTPPKDPEQVRLSRDKKLIQSRMKKLREKIAAGDYTLAVKRDPAMDDEKRKLQFEEHKLKEEWLKGVFEEQLRNRNFAKKSWDTALDTANTVRSVMASSELSGVMRQGGFLVGAHPIQSIAALKDMVKAIKSEQGFYETQQAIRDEPDYQNGKFQAADLYIAEDAPASLEKTEEAYMSRWVNDMKGWKGAAFGSVAGAIHGAREGGFIGLLTGSTYMGAVGGGIIGGTIGATGWTPASQRAYIAFLNRLRVDRFKALEATLTMSGKSTAMEAKVLANFVNVATGRGTLGFKALERSVKGLNAAFFAPKYVASRFQLLLLQPLWKGNARTRKVIALEYARYLAGTSIVMAMLAALKDDDDKPWEWNLTSSDFMKSVWNNVRLDAGTGLLQNVNFLSRMISGEMKSTKGKVYDLSAPKTLTDPTRGTVAARFFRSKAAPIPGVVMDWMFRENVVGEPFTWRTALERSAAPMSAAEIEDAAMDLGFPRGAIAAAAVFFGIGANTHEVREKKPKKTKAPDYTAKPF